MPSKVTERGTKGRTIPLSLGSGMSSEIAKSLSGLLTTA
uniref:Uncharacterized protein n=1 Tax=Arundo donax TaxID=35708 RepID=A0A0A9FD52_ARUDO